MVNPPANASCHAPAPPVYAPLAPLLDRVADRLFNATDTVCCARARLFTEGWDAHPTAPPALRRARAVEHVLRHLPLDLESNPYFAGNTSTAPRAWMFCPEFGFEVMDQALYEHHWLRPDWLEARVPKDLRDAWQGRRLGGRAAEGHLIIDIEAVVNRGVGALIEDIERRDDGSPTQRHMRQAMAISMRALIAWSHRYADAAAAAAQSADDPVIAACYRRVAEACRHVPEHPARNLFEGLQALTLAHLAVTLEGQGESTSVGTVDRALARFTDEAAADAHQAAVWCGAFLLKVAANSLYGSVSKTQAVTLGGADAAGRDCCNAVTLAFLNAYASVPVSDPHCFVRWHRNLDDNTWSRSLDLLSSGRSMPQLVNDHEVAPALIAVGMEPEDAWNYAIVGCNEVGVPGRAWQCAYPRGIAINDVEVLDHVLRRQPEARTDGDALLNAYEQEVLQRTRRSIQGRIRTNARLADERPFPLTSALMQGCADAGDDYHRGMPYSDLFAAYVRGTTNATNALAALNKVVWEDREMTVEALLSAVDADDAPVMERLHRCPRWGQDDERADCWAVRLSQRRTAAMQQAASEAGLPPIVCCHVVRSLHHTDGARLGPTPDGRPGRSPVADSIGAAPGDATHGPTAMLNSVLKLNARRDYAGIYNLNVTLPGGAASSPPVLRALVEAFFADGGQELQINVLDAATLRAARQDPARFRDLVVRIAGLNARFVELGPAEQDELIARAEEAERLR